MNEFFASVIAEVSSSVSVTSSSAAFDATNESSAALSKTRSVKLVSDSHAVDLLFPDGLAVLSASGFGHEL